MWIILDIIQFVFHVEIPDRRVDIYLFTTVYLILLFYVARNRKIKNFIYIWQYVVNVVDNKELYLRKTYLEIV